MSLEYFPLLPGDTTGILEVNSNDLGAYPYELILSSTAGGQENSIIIETTLGTSAVKEASFKNFAKTKSEFFCSVSLKLISFNFFCVILLLVLHYMQLVK